jgi:VCBS repeat protein
MISAARILAGVWLALGSTVLLAQVLPPGVTNKPGFPKILAGGNAPHGQPAVADLGLTPGHKSIVFGTSGHKLYIVEYDGTVAPGFPVTLPADVYSSPAIGDLDNDGIPDIVVGYGSTLELASPGGVRAFKRDGTVLWDRPSGDFVNVDGIADPVMSTPAIGDIDGDGAIEVAWGSLDANVYVVDGRNGQNKPGWPHFVRDTIFSSPALADLDGNGKLEVIIGADAHAEGPPFNTPDGGCLHAFRFDATEVPGFPQCIDQVIISSPAVGDINGDGKPDIVVGTGRFYANRLHRLYAFRCDGSAVPGWPVAVDGQVTTAPALADLDGDGVLDVVATDEPAAPSTLSEVYAFKGSGALMWKRTPRDYFGQNLSAGNPVVADILGDGNVEVIVSTNTELCVFTRDGTQLTDSGSHTTFSFFGTTTMSSPVVTDFENDGVGTEIVALSASPFPAATDTKVYVWTTKVSAAAPWPMFRQNSTRPGMTPGTPSCAGVSGPPTPLNFFTLAPCRILDTRNASGPYGGPALSAQATRFFVVGGQCGIPADAKAVSVNVTVTGASNAGDLRFFPGSTLPPPSSTINFHAGGTRANNAVVGLSLTGVLSVRDDQAIGQVQLVVDTNGYFK